MIAEENSVNSLVMRRHTSAETPTRQEAFKSRATSQDLVTMYQLLELVVLLATASLCIGRELTGPPPDERAWLRFLIPPTLYLLAERLFGIGLTHPRVASRLPPRTPQLS